MDDSTPPPCEASGPDGSRLVIRPAAATDSVADLARALDLPASTILAIDGRPVASYERLLAAGLQVGSAITVSEPPLLRQPLPVCEPARATCATSVGVEVAVAVGPACERWATLPPGRHSVGRATSAAIRVDDPAVELHHGVLDVNADGSATFTQLTGAFPVTIDGVPCAPCHPIGTGEMLAMGTSRLLVRAVGRTAAHSMAHSSAHSTGQGSIVPADRDPWRRVVRRGPVAPSGAPTDAFVVPGLPAAHRAPPLTSLVGAAVAAAGAGVLAAVLGQLLFAVFAAVGAVVSIATWAVGALVARRDRRRDDTTHRAELADFDEALRRAHAAAERDHRLRHRSVVDALDVVHGDGSNIWSRRVQPAGALWSTIGRGTCRWTPPIDADARVRLDAELLVTLGQCERLVDVAVPLALEVSSVVAIHGPTDIGAALCRSVIVQFAATYGPADWELQVVTSSPDRWGWVSWLPQTGHRPAVIAASDTAALADAMQTSDATSNAASNAGHRRRTVIVLDVAELLSARTGPIRRRLGRGDVACLVLVAPEVSVPAVVDRILELGDTGTARWIDTDGSIWPTADHDIVVAGVSTCTAEAAARRLAPLIDPEDHDGSGGMPTGVSLAELEPLADDAATVIARRWMNAGRDPAPVARLGMSADGVVDIDLARDGPHALVAGTTGSGKSELLRTLVASLAAQSGPDHVTMILVDYKGGSTFDACARLPHTVGVVTDLDDGLAERVLVSLDAEVRRRERLLRAVGVDDLTGYRRVVDHHDHGPLPRLVVVIDEFASLAKELPDFLGALVSIAQRGRSLGIHLLLATQRPAGVVTDDIRANTNLRIALRLQDRSDADDVVGDPAPARFPVASPGRAALRLGPDELVVFQTASTCGPLPPRSGRLRVEPVGIPTTEGGPGATLHTAGPSVLEHVVDAIGRAAAMVGGASPHRPWIDALPAVVRPRDLGEDHLAIGLLEDPAGQCRRSLSWTADSGNLVLVGALGAGTTTAAVAVAAALARTESPDVLHLYVVDARGDAAWAPFETLAHCGAVVRVSEIERLTRLLARLAAELDRRGADARRVPTIVVVIDGFAAVRDALDDVAHGHTAIRLDRLLRDGPAVGIVAVVTTDGSSSKGLGVPRSATWVFHVPDQGIARTAGLRGPVVTAGVPGRMRVVDSGLEGQVVFDPEPLRGTACETGGGPAAVLVLPEVVDADELDALEATIAYEPRAGRPIELVLGLAADTLERAVLRVPVGDHVFIGGAARTGRSTALRQVEAAWARVHPGGVVVRVDRHHPIDTDALTAMRDGAGDVLVVVDDAERIDDPGGDLARLVALPGFMFAVAARVEAVRVAYGHWAREVARSRCGLIMTSMGDIDGELLGATLPRRSSVAPRPGLAWMIDQDGHRLVQVAARMPA
jgi:S-DNA-T family DNA segregation ATPase FtsK/SpoIIIE